MNFLLTGDVQFAEPPRTHSMKLWKKFQGSKLTRDMGSELTRGLQDKRTLPFLEDSELSSSFSFPVTLCHKMATSKKYCNYCFRSIKKKEFLCDVADRSGHDSS
mmetsp:Transcript_94993/g.193180  ORF Transcript_94993/g.193180 Transcript_94993/m.193180 type:complete len:104 (-) Transcript_94993:153-464(-)